MSLSEFHCELLEVEGKFSATEFNEEAFLSDVKSRADVGQSRGFRWSFGSAVRKEHAHLSVTLPEETEEKKKTGRFRLSYHKSEFEVEDEPPPYMEDCATWLGQFFTIDDLQTETNALFIFEENYEPTLNLPFPLVTENKELSGATVSGLTIEPSVKSRFRRVMIQRTENDILIYCFGKHRINLKTFDVSKELERMSVPVRALIKEKTEQAK